MPLQTSSRRATSDPLVARPAWLLFILTLQGQQQAVRMRVWRALKSLGTAVLRDGVYLLPNRREFVEALHEQADEVDASAGSAQIFEVSARDDEQESEFRQLFDRTPEYEKLMLDIRGARKEIGDLERAALSARLMRLRRDYEAIVARDFFAGAARDQTGGALEDLARAAMAVLSPDEPHAIARRIQRVNLEKYRGRTWATRARPWADRLASAWLIRRFIDRRAVGFDFDGAEFTHVGAKVTFEVLLSSFGLEEDPALGKIAALIHYLDVGGVPVAEAAGIEALLRGARTASSDDDRLVAEAAKLFDFLYANYGAGV
jgi:hypothetical protein